MSRKVNLDCPACNSSEIRYLSGSKSYYCRHCGCKFTITRHMSGIDYDVFESPTTKAQRFNLFRKWGE